MTIIPTPTLDQVLTLATRLLPADKLRLIERLVPQVAQVLAADDPLTELDTLIAESSPLGSAERDSAEVLSEMRR